MFFVKIVSKLGDLTVYSYRLGRSGKSNFNIPVDDIEKFVVELIKENKERDRK
jgi:hypothetical protein